MSKIISFRGTLAPTEQERVRLTTLNGKTGYLIKKFQVIEITPGQSDVELICKIYTKSQAGAVSNTVEFTESDLLAVAWREGTSSKETGDNETIIFDNEKFNQDIYVTMHDAAGNTVSGNYYIELEVVNLSDLEATMLTLKNLRTISSR